MRLGQRTRAIPVEPLASDSGRRISPLPARPGALSSDLLSLGRRRWSGPASPQRAPRRDLYRRVTAIKTIGSPGESQRRGLKRIEQRGREKNKNTKKIKIKIEERRKTDKARLARNIINTRPVFSSVSSGNINPKSLE